MSPRVCICCGQPITEKANAFSRNPNTCPSCANLLGAIEECEPASLGERAASAGSKLGRKQQTDVKANLTGREVRK